MAGGTYRIREFAELAGVTVRALHHYDRLGLLKPRRTPTGYRVYGATDLEILEQIVALKFIGLPLDKIKLLLRRKPAELSAALRAQRTLLDQRKSLLERAIWAIGQAEMTLQNGGQADSRVFRHIIEVIEMQNDGEEWKKQYDALVQASFEQLPSMSPDARTQLREQFADLFKDVEGALGEEPASPRAQQLADRCAELLRILTVKGKLDPRLLKIAAAYLSGGECPAGAPPEPPFGGKPVWEFMGKALAVRQ
jgi:MerR family transcriptional regulator, thiopeptide resistance regulator